MLCCLQSLLSGYSFARLGQAGVSLHAQVGLQCSLTCCCLRPHTVLSFILVIVLSAALLDRVWTVTLADGTDLVGGVMQVQTAFCRETLPDYGLITAYDPSDRSRESLGGKINVNSREPATSTNKCR